MIKQENGYRQGDLIDVTPLFQLNGIRTHSLTPDHEKAYLEEEMIRSLRSVLTTIKFFGKELGVEITPDEN